MVFKVQVGDVAMFTWMLLVNSTCLHGEAISAAGAICQAYLRMPSSLNRFSRFMVLALT